MNTYPSSNNIHILITQLPVFTKEMGADSYVDSTIQSIEACRPWMHHNCPLLIHVKDAHQQSSVPVNEEFQPELIGIPWRFALTFQARKWHLYSCKVLRSHDLSIDHEYLFFFCQKGSPLSTEFLHNASWWVEDPEEWIRQSILRFSAPHTTVYDPYQNPKIKQIALANERRWLGEG